MPGHLIVNADDFNLTPGVSQGIMEAHRRGIVTSTTAMVNLPGLEGSRDLAREAPRLGIGLHLNLTFGPPVLPPERVGSLVGGDGRFIRDGARLGEAGDPAEMRAELAAQAGRFQAAFGRRPSHLDSHHHIHRHPLLFQTALALAEELRVPLRALSPEMAERIRERGLPAADRLVGDVGPEAYWSPARLLALLARMAPGVTELMCHPGHADAPLAASSYREQREGELRSLCDPAVRAALRDGGITCISYRDLAAIRASRP